MVEQKQRICLSMMVKNESHVIARCLESVKPIIDTWVIVDTGSTDGTQEIIHQVLRDIPGTLLERPWVDFSYNRTESVHLAQRAKANYILLMDADDYLLFDADFSIPVLTSDVYLVVKREMKSEREFYKERLLKSDLDWHWQGEIHEKIQDLTGMTQNILTGITYIYTNEGARYKDRQRDYQKELQILEDSYQKEPSRTTLHNLASTYVMTGQYEKAIACYEQLAQQRKVPDYIFRDLLTIAQLREYTKQDPKRIEESYLTAFLFDPNRVESLYGLARFYRKQKEHQKAYEIASMAVRMSRPFALDIDYTIYEYHMLFEYALSAYWAGKYRESLDAFERLLAKNELPQHVKEDIRKNQIYAWLKSHPQG